MTIKWDILMGSREFDSMHYSDEGRALERTFLIG